MNKTIIYWTNVVKTVAKLYGITPDEAGSMVVTQFAELGAKIPYNTYS